jgi:hypothetical protein
MAETAFHSLGFSEVRRERAHDLGVDIGVSGAFALMSREGDLIEG